jgi:hypothetical protein
VRRDKYFSGPGGVYYHAKEDILFTLEPTGAQLFNMKKGLFDGRMYEYHSRGKHFRSIAVTNMQRAVRIGEL